MFFVQKNNDLYYSLIVFSINTDLFNYMFFDHNKGLFYYINSTFSRNNFCLFMITVYFCERMIVCYGDCVFCKINDLLNYILHSGHLLMTLISMYLYKIFK